MNWNFENSPFHAEGYIYITTDYGHVINIMDYVILPI